MLIDWFTVGAQIINFLVLLAILRYFLYDRILAAIKAREETIAQMHEEAEKAIGAAEATRMAFEAKAEELESDRKRRLEGMEKEIEAARQGLIRQAQQETDQLKERWQEHLRNQSEAFVMALSQQALHESCEMARSLLSEMADASLEEQMIRAMARELERLPVEKKEQLREAIAVLTEPITVRSGFHLSPTSQAQLRDTLKQTIGYQGEWQFQVDPSLICGAVLSVGGFEIRWELKEQLQAMEQSMARSIADATKGASRASRFQKESGDDAPGSRLLISVGRGES